MGQNLASHPSLQWVLGSALPNPHAMYPAVLCKGTLTKGRREDSEVQFPACASSSLGHFLYLRILLLSSDDIRTFIGSAVPFSLGWAFKMRGPASPVQIIGSSHGLPIVYPALVLCWLLLPVRDFHCLNLQEPKWGRCWDSSPLC